MKSQQNFFELVTRPEASQFMDGINIMSYDYYWAGYNYTMDIQGLMGLGVPKSKIVLGLMPGKDSFITLDHELLEMVEISG